MKKHFCFDTDSDTVILIVNTPVLNFVFVFLRWTEIVLYCKTKSGSAVQVKCLQIFIF